MKDLISPFLLSAVNFFHTALDGSADKQLAHSAGIDFTWWTATIDLES